MEKINLTNVLALYNDFYQIVDCEFRIANWNRVRSEGSHVLPLPKGGVRRTEGLLAQRPVYAR